ncbi:hypothetical protein E2C01_022953 [Portunus trituberculatus]|uniref:Uncharacterized protein n=1 Tax=Portunus trituberculatus TaxID=210409 RepID=A0A5B7E8M9_PORTR|nr:hypothetical protein [Portunus trituberculatus]
MEVRRQSDKIFILLTGETLLKNPQVISVALENSRGRWREEGRQPLYNPRGMERRRWCGERRGGVRYSLTPRQERLFS